MHFSGPVKTKALDPIAALKTSISSKLILLIKLSFLFMFSTDHSSHLSLLSSKQRFGPGTASVRISIGLHRSSSVPAIILSSKYHKCYMRFIILFDFSIKRPDCERNYNWTQWISLVKLQTHSQQFSY